MMFFYDATIMPKYLTFFNRLLSFFVFEIIHKYKLMRELDHDHEATVKLQCFSAAWMKISESHMVNVFIFSLYICHFSSLIQIHSHTLINVDTALY